MVLADLVVVQVGVGEQFVVPLPRQLPGGDQDQRLPAHLAQHAECGDRLPGARWGGEHPGLAFEEPVDPLALVVAQFRLHRHGQRLTRVEIPVVADGVARLVEGAFDRADGVFVHPRLRLRDRGSEVVVGQLLARNVPHQLLAVGPQHDVAVLVGVEDELVGAFPLLADPRLQLRHPAREHRAHPVEQCVEIRERGRPDVLRANLVEVASGPWLRPCGVDEVGELR